jgi:translation initiation factor 2 beta subunit (eIF-2beta)/eIF-5
MSTYPYDLDYLVNRIYEHSKPIKKVGKSTFHIIPPSISNTANKKKTMISNFPIICTNLNRTINELMEFFKDELQTCANLTIDNYLVLRGFFRESHIQTILAKYVKTYVICHICKSGHTEISKKDKLTFVSCVDCLSQRPVSSN